MLLLQTPTAAAASSSSASQSESQYEGLKQTINVSKNDNKGFTKLRRQHIIY